MKQLNIDASWLKEIEQEFEKEYMQQIFKFLRSEQEERRIIYPQEDQIFAALGATHFNDVKVVILGQDPYHGEWQAHGLSFSVPAGVKAPPSLKNIFKEIGLPLNPSMRGDLTPWTQQWVLLLNAILSVRAWEPASHSKIGWQQFTDNIIQTLSDKREGIIFLLWGNFARSKKSLIDTSKHHVLEAPHPSPFSAHSGFFWCGHFVQVNEILREKWETEIDWNI